MWFLRYFSFLIVTSYTWLSLFIVRHFALLWATDFDKRHRVATFPFFLRHLSDDVLYISMLLLFPSFFFSPFTAEDYTGKSFVVRERAPSRFVFRLWRSKDRSSLPSVRDSGSRAKSCVFPRNWTGSISRGVSPRFPSAILEDASGTYMYTYIHIYVYMYKQASCIRWTTHWDRKILLPPDLWCQTGPWKCIAALSWIFYYHLIFIVHHVLVDRPYLNITMISHIPHFGWFLIIWYFLL